jgi:hypothetical protein
MRSPFMYPPEQLLIENVRAKRDSICVLIKCRCHRLSSIKFVRRAREVKRSNKERFGDFERRTPNLEISDSQSDYPIEPSSRI